MPKPKSLIKIYGGKSYQIPQLTQTFKRYPHNIFVDGFFGGGNILLNKKKVSREIVCDLNEPLINLYKVVRDNPKPLYNILRTKEYSKETFDWAVDYNFPQENVNWAAKYLIRNRMSFSGLMGHYSWSNRIRRGMPENVSSYLGTIERIFTVSERLQGVDIRNQNTLDLLDRCSTFLSYKNVLLYCDPPYCDTTRVTPDVYEHEMSRDDHIRLLNIIKDAKCGVVISGYASDLYESYLDKWQRFEYPVKVNMSKRKDGKMNDRTEVLWSNF